MLAAADPVLSWSFSRGALRGDVFNFSLGLVFVLAGVISVLNFFSRPKSKERLLLWFGFLSGLYGVRMLVRLGLVRMMSGAISGDFWNLSERCIDNVILIPALLCIEELYGRGWRGSLRWLIWAQAAFAIIYVPVSLWRNRAPEDPASVVLLVIALLVAWGAMRGYRPPAGRDNRILGAGGACFILTAANDHLTRIRFVPWQVNLEAFGFFVFLGCLAFITGRRYVRNERQLLSMQEEMRSATRIQTAILPRGVPEIAGVKVAVRYVPMQAVAGDFYEFIPVEGGLGVLVADVAGHGVPAALVASMIKVAAYGQREHAGEPGRMLAGINDTLCGQARGQFATGCYAVLDTARRKLRYTAGGHPPMLLLARGGQLIELPEGGPLMGFRAGLPYPEAEVSFGPGDRVVMYSDGISEAANAADEFFGAGRLRKAMVEFRELPADAFADALLKDVSAWARVADGGNHGDDLTLVVIDFMA
jgi:sigma-B regulation protein RsbU (phosphoserine phosphatase)